MSDEKLHPEDSQAEGAAHKAEGAASMAAKGAGAIKSAVEGAGHAVADSVKTAAKETRYEWDLDKKDAQAFKEREVEKIHRAKEDLTHPSILVQDAKSGVEHTYDVVKDEAAKVVDEVTHPKRTLKAIEASATQIKDTVTKGVSDTEAALHGVESGQNVAIDKQKLPIGLKIFGVLCILGALYSVSNIVDSIISLVNQTRTGNFDGAGTSTIVVLYVQMVVQVLTVATFILLGERLLRNRRRLAALATDTLFVLIIAGAICSIMLRGINLYLIGYGVLAVIAISLQAYIDPSLSEERQLKRKLRDMDMRDEAEAGTLGYDTSGKGYITLNFFNLFWIFVVCSVLGLIVETVVHFLFVVPGQYQDRAGLLFGPFSPIYGCGAVLMTVFLNRFHKSNVVLVFVVAAIIGGLFEVFTSYFMQYAFGAVAWDYTGEFPFPLFGGRTCVFMMCCWGLLGVVWIKLLLPLMLRLVNLIPWNWRYGLTAVCATLMLVDAVMTLQSLDCWYERLSNDPVDTPIQKFYDEHFDDQYMANRFQSMTIHPTDAVRGGK